MGVVFSWLVEVRGNLGNVCWDFGVLSLKGFEDLLLKG